MNSRGSQALLADSLPLLTFLQTGRLERLELDLHPRRHCACASVLCRLEGPARQPRSCQVPNRQRKGVHNQPTGSRDRVRHRPRHERGPHPIAPHHFRLQGLEDMVRCAVLLGQYDWCLRVIMLPLTQHRQQKCTLYRPSSTRAAV